VSKGQGKKDAARHDNNTNRLFNSELNAHALIKPSGEDKYEKMASQFLKAIDVMSIFSGSHFLSTWFT
jgi:hypothetical protein